LRAGVPTVIASFWDVDDQATRTLTVQFHRALLRTGDPDRALLEAKRFLVASSPDMRAPWYWAGFVLVGASAPDRD
jgi:CHAT domain-containing protein